MSYTKLPPETPVQWSDGAASTLADKKFIFAYPVACIVIHYLLRPFIYAKLQINSRYGEIMTEYLINYMCFIALSIEIFSLLFIYGVVKNIVVVLFVDTAALLGLLGIGLAKMNLKGKIN